MEELNFTPWRSLCILLICSLMIHFACCAKPKLYFDDEGKFKMVQFTGDLLNMQIELCNLVLQICITLVLIQI